jgi:hypothetical protein
MRSSIKSLFSCWKFDNIKVARRVILSVVGATVVLIGIALLVLLGPAFVVSRWASRFSPRSMGGPAGGSEKFAVLRAMLPPIGRRQFAISSHRPVVARTRNAQPTVPNTRLTTQNERFFVSAEIAAMAIAIWNMVTARANTSCL